MKQLSVSMFSYHTCPLASFEGKETGGMNVYVLELSRSLGNLGVAVDIFTRSQDTNQPKMVSVAEKVRLLHIPAGPERPYPKKKLQRFIPEFIKNIQKFTGANNLHYDLCHAHYYLSGLAAAALSNLNHERKPLVITFHTLALMKNLVARTAQEKESRFRIEAEFKLVKAAQRIIAASQNDRSYLVYLYGCQENKVSVVTPGVNTELFRPIPVSQARKAIGAHPCRKIILFVGRIEPLKGIDVLLYAMKILLNRNPRLKLCLFVVGGDVSQKRHLWSGELKKLESLQRLLQIETVVRFVGQQPQQKLPFYYNAADVVVMPSHYESFGLSALEAMACGRPVIATNVSGVTGLLDKRSETLVASANNPLLLASQIESLLSDEKRRRGLSRELPTSVANFSWERTGRETLAIYRQLLSS